MSDTTTAETAARMAEIFGTDHTNLLLGQPSEAMFDKQVYINYWRSVGYEVVEEERDGVTGVRTTRPETPERMAELKAEYRAERQRNRRKRRRIWRWR